MSTWALIREGEFPLGGVVGTDVGKGVAWMDNALFFEGFSDCFAVGRVAVGWPLGFSIGEAVLHGAIASHASSQGVPSGDSGR